MDPQDRTDHARILQLLQEVTALCNAHRSFAEALAVAVPLIAQRLDFGLGHALMRQPLPEGDLRSAGIWYLAEAAYRVFQQASLAEHWNPARGLPGRVEASRAPEWVGDIHHNPDFHRVGESEDCPLNAGVGVPVLAGDHVIAVLEFYREDDSPPAEGLLAVLAQIGTQLGRVWERERSDREIRSTRGFLEKTLENLGEAVFVVSERRIRLANGCAYEMFEAHPGQLLGEDFRGFLVDPSDEKCVGDAALLAVREGGVHHASCDLRRPTGSSFPAEITLSRLDPGNPDDPSLVVIVRDMSRQRELEEQLVVSQKLEAVGRLAAGVAHDFNNLLTIMAAHLSFLEHRVGADDASGEDVRTLQHACDRAGKLTAQLLAFGRRQVMEATRVDLNEAVRTTSRLLERSVGEEVWVQLELDPTAPAIEIDPGQLEQVLVNLGMNARDAMPEGGRLLFRTRLVPVEDEGGEGTGRAVLEVIDDGEGMDEATRQRIFEPFFSTKRERGGSGLGLATCYGIVKQSGGDIEVESAPGRGTRFRMGFPALEPAVVVGAGAPSPSRERRVVGGTALLAEDDPLVRRSLRRVLAAGGYDVVEASDAASALRWLSAHQEECAAAVIDMVLPGPRGRDLAWEIARRYPEMPMVCITGHAEVWGHGARPLPAGVEILHKPFPPDELIEALQGPLRPA